MVREALGLEVGTRIYAGTSTVIDDLPQSRRPGGSGGGAGQGSGQHSDPGKRRLGRSQGPMAQIGSSLGSWFDSSCRSLGVGFSCRRVWPEAWAPYSVPQEAQE